MEWDIKKKNGRKTWRKEGYGTSKQGMNNRKGKKAVKKKIRST